MKQKPCIAVVLAAGTGSRMHSSVAKQFMELQGKPLIFYALKAMEESEVIDTCILVTGEAHISYVKREIVEKYGFQKVQAVIAGGEERYASVACAMRYIRETMKGSEGVVFIHDGARPFLTGQILRDTYEAVQTFGACVAAVPSKDTVKLTDAEGFAVDTPDRRRVWNVQTPQVFEMKLITDCYAKLDEEAEKHAGEKLPVTDDASVVEMFTNHKVRMVPSSYENIKVTTPDDLVIAEAFLNNRRQK